MRSKHRLVLMMAVLAIGSLAIFALASAAVLRERVYLPAVFSVTGAPQPPATRTPGPVGTPTATATVGPTATAVPRHFDDCAFKTGNDATVAVLLKVTISGNLVLAKDDEIAIFTPDGSICAGMTPWDGENNIAVTAWGDDSQTEEIDGLRTGEEMKFRIWDRSLGKEIPVKTAEYAEGDGFYRVGGRYIVKGFALE